ncbi:MAG: MFS transporter [Deltaproteobacteria bacterium RBG_13_43_22]|nr:MAG: MFS transporter [Deltaproteobacteria bacterium RBG_13_43_22]
MQENPSEKICGLNRNIFFTGVVSFFMDFSSEMVYPLVPLFLSSVLGVQKSVIGLIEGIAESTASLLKVFSGWLSDRLGHRKWLMVVGYGISTLSRPLVATAPNWGQVLASRFLDRFGKGVRNAPRDALIAESCEAPNLGRSFGFHRGMDTLGAVVGPAVAFGLLAYFHGQYRLVFWLSMIPGALAVLTIIFFIRETKAHPLDQTEKPKLGWASFSGSYKFFILVVTLFSLGNSSDVFLILRAENVGIPAAVIPLVYLVFNVIYSLGALPAGILSDRIGPKPIIFLAFTLFGFIYLGFGKASHPVHIWLLFIVYGIFMAMTEGVQKAFLATLVPSEFKATGFGLYNTLVGLAMLPASLIGGFLWDRLGPQATFLYGSVTAWLAALLFIFFLLLPKSSRVASVNQ